jgi:hypothetical protein
MAFEFIQIPANGQGSAKEELNKLLRHGRLASRRRVSENAGGRLGPVLLRRCTQPRIFTNAPTLSPRSHVAFAFQPRGKPPLTIDAHALGFEEKLRPPSRSHPVSGCDKMTNHPSGAGSPVDAGSKAPGGHLFNPNGIVSQSPRLPRGTRGYLGMRVRDGNQPRRGCVVWDVWDVWVRFVVRPRNPDATPVGLAETWFRIPKVAACRRNLGLWDRIPLGFFSTLNSQLSTLNSQLSTSSLPTPS